MGSETKITKHYFEFGTIKYFRGKADGIQLLSFGNKKDPLGPQAYLAVHSNVRRDLLQGRVHQGKPVTIDWSQTNAADLEANGQLRYFDVGVKLSIGADVERVRSGELQLVKFFVNERDVLSLLNNQADGAREFLAEAGNDGRLVHEIWVLMKGALAEHFASSANISVSAGKGDATLEVTASGGTRGTQTVVFSEGATFAFLMLKVKKWGKGKSVVEELEDDLKGMG